MDTTVSLTTDSVPLGALLKLAGVADSGGHAKHLIQGGQVRVNGAEETRRGSHVRRGDLVEIQGEEPVRISVR